MKLFNRKLGVASASLLSMTLALAGCSSGNSSAGSGSPGSASTQKLKIGAVYLDTQGFYAGVTAGVKKAASESGRKVSFVETNTQDDPGKESQFIDTLISSQANAIVLSAASAQGSVAAMRTAFNAHMPIICYNTCINMTDAKKYVYAYVEGDSLTFGYKTGLAAVAYFKKNNITDAEIGIVNCEFVEQCQLRRAGFEKALKESNIKYKILANQQGTDATKAVGIATNMLTANPTINVLYGESGGAAEGAVTAVQEKGQAGKVVVFGSDMTSVLAKALQDHTILKATINVSGTATGLKAFKAAMDAADGIKKPADLVIPVPIDVYTTSAQGAEWLKTHADGIP